mgnify:FL=1
MNKILITLLAIFSLITPSTVGAATVPWTSTSTLTNWISPTKVNGVFQIPMATSFIATSTTATSTFFQIGSQSGNFIINSAGRGNYTLINPYGNYVGVNLNDPTYYLDVGGNFRVVATSTETSETLTPDGDSTPLTLEKQDGGTTNQYISVLTDDADTTYVGSDFGGTDIFTLSASTLTEASITSIQLCTVGRDSSGTMSFFHKFKIGGTEYSSAQLTFAGQHGTTCTSWITNPATGTKWLVSELASLEAGVQIPAPESLPANALISTQSRSKRIDEVKVGDLVLSWNGSVEVDVVDGVYVHNKNRKYHNFYTFNGMLRVTGNHPVLTNHGYINAEDVVKGDVLLSQVGMSVVYSIEKDTSDEVIYDISVKKNQNFFANNILVHNVTVPKVTQLYVTVNYIPYTTRFNVLSTGNVGIGTSSPYAKLSVVGQAVAAYFTATTSPAARCP